MAQSLYEFLDVLKLSMRLEPFQVVDVGRNSHKTTFKTMLTERASAENVKSPSLVFTPIATLTC
jgi:DNA phosphorothioation-dependent restriction protein DptG